MLIQQVSTRQALDHSHELIGTELCLGDKALYLPFCGYTVLGVEPARWLNGRNYLTCMIGYGCVPGAWIQPGLALAKRSGIGTQGVGIHGSASTLARK